MKIERLELYHVAEPLDAPLKVAAQPGFEQPANELTFVRMTTDEGVIGESAGMTISRFHAGLGETFGNFILGRDPTNIEGFDDILQGGQALGMRLAWLEPALWDILGKLSNQPVYRLLGGGSNKLRAYCSTSELREPERRAEDLQRFREMGFTAVKLRAHHFDWRDDLAVVARAREVVGDDMDILVDANQGYHFALAAGAPPKWDLRTAAAFARELEEFDVYWLEEPLDRNDYEGLAELRQRTEVRLAGGELNWRLQEYALLTQMRCLDVIQADAMFFGGISGTRKVAALAEAAGLGFAAHTWNSGFALLANMHVMASVPNRDLCEFPYEPPAWTTRGRDALQAVTTEIDSEGYVHMPDRPGLGVVVDEERLAKYGERFYDAHV